MAISLCQCGTLLTSGGWSRLVLASRLSRATPYSAIGYQTRAERGARGPGQSSIRPGFLPHMAPPSPSLPVTPLPRSRTAAVRRWRRGRAVITSQQTGCHPSSGRRSAAVACAERATRHSVVGAAECVRGHSCSATAGAGLQRGICPPHLGCTRHSEPWSTPASLSTGGFHERILIPFCGNVFSSASVG